MREGSADSMIACLESIDWETPQIDRPRVERAVTAHLLALDLPAVPFVWYPRPRAAGFARMRSEPVCWGMHRGWGSSPSWTQRFCRRARSSELFRDAATDGPPESPLLGARVRSDNQLFWMDVASDLGTSSLLATTHVLNGIRALRAGTPKSPHLLRKRWWYAGVPGKALPALEHLAGAAAAGLFAMWHAGSRCHLVPRPRLRTENGQLHCWNGRAAATWEDGVRYWLWRGVHVPDWIGKRPDDLTTEQIHLWQNAEWRRVAIERFGYQSYLQETGARLVNTDRFGKLWHSSLENPLAFLEVVNSTPEPDGTYKTYFLSVPPNLRTPRAAVAWTFGLKPREYAPALET